MSMTEYAATIICNHQPLLSIIHQGQIDNDTAVLMLVGGPQYRVGSHRQFVQLSRFLAKHGVTSMRFDYRGMGDSYGDKASFEESEEDIRAAIDQLFIREPQIKKVVLWGLCDAASMALIYAWQDARVTGLVLLNPWLENETAKAKAMLRHYYVKRFFSKAFWAKLFSGKVNIQQGVKEASQFAQAQRQNADETNNKPAEGYQRLMLQGLKQFAGQITVILSGDDLTAQTFEQQVKHERQWKTHMTKKVHVHKISEADHTFSSHTWKHEVEMITLTAITSLNG